MSTAAHDAFNVPDAGIGNSQYPHQSAQNQTTHGISTFADGSGPIFSMYLDMAAEEDKKMVENWKADADGILIFTGLFSAAVASFISVSIQDIRPNPQDTSNFYLANIYQTVADPNRSNVSSSLPASPPPFSPPDYAVWVNTLWFMSLVISLTCALLATLLQQWARKYLEVVTQPRYSPHKRARIRAFFAEGVDKLLLSWAVEALPTLLHISLFLFFGGLAVFLCNVELTTFKWVASWIGICAALYGCITLVPIFRHDSPYHTPLSLPVWHIVTGITYVIFRFLQWFIWSFYYLHETWVRFVNLEISYRQRLVQGMQKTAEEAALHSPSEIDARTFMWTLDSLDEDHELERFFSGLPGFCSSKVVEDPLHSLPDEQNEKLSTAFWGLLNRTFSSDLLPKSIINRRAIICAKAFPLAGIFSFPQSILWRLYNGQYEGLCTAEFGHIVRGWAHSLRGDEHSLTAVQAIVTCIIALAQRRNDSWFILASEELGVPESVLRNHATHGDSLSLAILIHITRQQFSHFHKESWQSGEFSNVLKAASKLNAQDISRELQHEFCTLWNQIVQKAQNDNDPLMAKYILGQIRNVYVTLHQDTDSAPTRFSASTPGYDEILCDPSVYPLCNVAGHHPDSTPHNHIDSTSTTHAHAIPHESNTLVLASPANSDVHSSSIPVVDSLTDHSPPPLQTTSEDLHIPASLDPAADGTMLHLTPETSTSAPPHSFISPLTFVPQHTAVLPTPILPSSEPVLNDPLPAESHHSIVVTTSPNTSPELISTPDLGAAVEDDTPKAGLCKQADTLDPPSVNHAFHMTTMATPMLDLSPSLPLVISDGAIAGSSQKEPDAERRDDYTPDPSHRQYDMV